MMFEKGILYHVSSKKMVNGEILKGKYGVIWCNLYPHIHHTIMSPSLDEDGTIYRQWYTGTVYAVEPYCPVEKIGFNSVEGEILLPAVRIIKNLGSVEDNLTGKRRTSPEEFGQWLYASFGQEPLPAFGIDLFYRLPEIRKLKGPRRKKSIRTARSMLRACPSLAKVRSFEKFDI